MVFLENQGTRITGNACHWIDLCQFFLGDSVTPVELTLINSFCSKDDCILSVKYNNGSIASIALTDKGNNLRGVQEYIEVKQNNCTYIIDDFLSFTEIDNFGKKVKLRKLYRDKGHKKMYETFITDVQKGSISFQYSYDALEKVGTVTTLFSQMLKKDIYHMYTLLV